MSLGWVFRQHDPTFTCNEEEHLAVGVNPMATFNPQTFLKQVGNGNTTLKSPKKQILFAQGNVSDAVFYIQAGKVKLTVVSPQGKEAVMAILEPSSFFGEECLTGQPVHLATATTFEAAIIVRIDKQAMLRLLKDDHTFYVRRSPDRRSPIRRFGLPFFHCPLATSVGSECRCLCCMLPAWLSKRNS